MSNPAAGCMSGGIYSPCDYSFWGASIAGLPGFGTEWGSFSDLEMWKYEGRLAYTRGRNGHVTPRGEGTDPQDTTLKDWQRNSVDKAIKLAKEMTDQSKGDSHKKCDEAVKKLSGGKISSLGALVSQFVSSGTAQNVFNGSKVPADSFGVDNPKIPAFVKFTGTSYATTYLNSKFFDFTQFGGVQAQAIVLLHEAIHQFGGLRDVDFDDRNIKVKDQIRGSRNITNAIIDNCAPALREVFRGLNL